MGHDQLFKLLLTALFMDFLRAFLPDLARQVDPRYLECLRDGGV